MRSLKTGRGLPTGELTNLLSYSTIRVLQEGGGVKKEQYDRLVGGTRTIRSRL